MRRATTPWSSAIRRLPDSNNSRAAYNESMAVTELLGKSGWNVESLIWDTTGTLVEPAAHEPDRQWGADASHATRR